MSTPQSVLPGAALQPNVPAGWQVEWSEQYHTSHYMNVYTGESTWTLPTEPAVNVEKQQYSTQVVGILPEQPLNIQQTYGGYITSPVSAISTQGSIFLVERQNVVYTQQEAVPALYFSPPPGSNQNQAAPIQQVQVPAQQYQASSNLAKTQEMLFSQYTAVEQVPPPPYSYSNEKDSQVLFSQAEKPSLYFPPPPPPPPQQQLRPSAQPIFNFPPPPTQPEKSQPMQSIDDFHLQARPAPNPITTRPRPRSFIGHLELLKLQASSQSQIYTAKVMDTKLGTKVHSLMPKTKPKDPEFILDAEGNPVLDADGNQIVKEKKTEKEEKEEKKLWDDRTPAEQKESLKKWGKRAAIGVGVVAAVVIGAEVIEHAANAGDAANSISSFGGGGGGMSVGGGMDRLGSSNDALNAAANASRLASMNAANNMAMMGLASAQANAAAMESSFATMASANW